MPVNERFVHASFSYPANFSQPSYASQEVTKLGDTPTNSAPYANANYHNSSLYVTTLNSSRINKNSASAHVPSSIMQHLNHPLHNCKVLVALMSHYQKDLKALLNNGLMLDVKPWSPWGFWLLLILGGCMNVYIDSSFTYPLFNHLSGGFDNFFKHKQVLQMTLLTAQCV